MSTRPAEQVPAHLEALSAETRQAILAAAAKHAASAPVMTPQQIHTLRGLLGLRKKRRTDKAA